MKYKLLLGGVKIYGVTDVKELVRRDIKQYISISGEAFCEDKGAALKYWRVDAELSLYDRESVDSLLDKLRSMGEDGNPQLLSVSSDMGSFSSRVLIQEMETAFISSETCCVTLGLLEYIRPVINVLVSGRPGTIPEPPQLAAACDVYKITTQYSRAGNTIAVKNPLTGVDIDNLAAIDVETLVKIEKLS